MPNAVCWMEGRILPLDQAKVPVLDHGLLYGDGVFEGIRFYHGQPFLLPAHLERLRDSARAIALEYPWSREEMAVVIADTIRAYGAADGYIRLIVTRGSGSLGIDPRSCGAPRLLVIADTLQMVGEKLRREGARVVIASTRRLPPDGLDPRIKSLNYLNHILARIEANRAGADEAILLNGQGRVTEGSADNLFIARDGILLTPPVSDGALAGVTRGLVLDLARNLGADAREQSLTPYDLHTADECFLTGTGAELIPVREVDGRPLDPCPGPWFTKLEQAFGRHIDRVCGGRVS